MLIFGSAQGFSQGLPVLPGIDISRSENGVVDFPGYVDDVFKVFSEYTKVYALNGKLIHIVAQPGISDEQIVYARKVLINHLTNVPGSLYVAKNQQLKMLWLIATQ